MPELPGASVDAIVTDPPYGIGFMGREWDTFAPERAQALAARRLRKGTPVAGQAWPTKTAKTVQGAGTAVEYDYSLAANRKFQAWCEEWAVEAMRVLKPGGYLIAFGGPRTFHRMTAAIEDAGFAVRDVLSWLYGQGFPKSRNLAKEFDRRAGLEGEVVSVRDVGPDMRANNYGNANGRMIATERAPASELGKKWAGWGTALKPAWEPIVLAQKPPEGSYAGNVETYGVGAINVRATRLPMDGDSSQEGRWPPNVAVDEESAAAIDEQSGERPGGQYPKRRGESFFSAFEGRELTEGGPRAMGDSGGASRFFYTAKADAEDRGPENDHPTVKPSSLMRWLVTLVTPPGGLVLDPFAGSGTTLAAARDVGARAIGIELQPEYLRLIEDRCRQEAFPW